MTHYTKGTPSLDWRSIWISSEPLAIADHDRFVTRIGIFEACIRLVVNRNRNRSIIADTVANSEYRSELNFSTKIRSIATGAVETWHQTCFKKQALRQINDSRQPGSDENIAIAVHLPGKT